jgi:hypothetical protein
MKAIGPFETSIVTEGQGITSQEIGIPMIMKLRVVILRFAIPVV